jgi:hypothetical protein
MVEWLVFLLRIREVPAETSAQGQVFPVPVGKFRDGTLN